MNRTQFSSCDTCRKARVKCDASSIKATCINSTREEDATCSRCRDKGVRCSFEWIKATKRKRGEAEGEDLPGMSSFAVAFQTKNGIDSEEKDRGVKEASLSVYQRGGARRRLEEPTSSPLTLKCFPLDDLLRETSDAIFEKVFGNVFGVFMGRKDPKAAICISPTTIFRRLDDFMNTHSRITDTETILQLSIHSFVARYIPIVYRQISAYTPAQHSQLITQTWRMARAQMLKAINLPASYRSLLALYLFSQTPTPSDIEEEEKMSGVSAEMCLMMALQMIQGLRERRYRSSSSSSSPPSENSTDPDKSMDKEKEEKEFLELENRAYWAVVVWDTSFSLSRKSSTRTSLTAGLRGACTEPVWRIVRAFLAGRLMIPARAASSADERVNVVRLEGEDEGERSVSEVTAIASVASVYIWKNVASLKEVLREGVEEANVLFVWGHICNALEIYNGGVKTQMNWMEERYAELDEEGQQDWCMASLRYCLGVLVLAETVRVYRRSDLYRDISQLVEDVEGRAPRVLELGMSSFIDVCGRVGGGSGEGVCGFSAVDPFLGEGRMVKQSYTKISYINEFHAMFSPSFCTFITNLFIHSSKAFTYAFQDSETIQAKTIQYGNMSHPWVEECQTLIGEWWRTDSPKLREFPKGKTIVICSNDSIALVGKVHRNRENYSNTTARTLTFKDRHKEKIDEMAEYGVDAYCWIWLDELNYVCAKFIKVNHGIEEETSRPIPSMEEGAEFPDVLNFVRPEHKNFYNHPVKRGSH
ncbi:hypothetical protein DM02DRAFT_730962 [Periconia macrospinosa]|uniref:Zn(2)-C6 fungal-type domain-containing protein n=1 Tax=Periconia macrospinosa TaxID=97972 RepID=A0A2V1DFC8_9PLEO|nr:hypothetical protein DM02DRAFT_730962 [Periconia macrospinosa]